MKITDITDEYIKKFLGENDLKGYEESYPALFEHYFLFWGNRDSFSKTLEQSEITERLKLIKKCIPKIEVNFKKQNLDVHNIGMILFVGQGCTNGHAFYDGENFIVWVPIESYSTEIQVLVFLAHEIVHALHYTKVPSYYFYTKEEKNNSMRQLVTEGLATYASHKIMGVSKEDALWADFLPKEKLHKWMRACEENKKEIARRILSKDLSDSRNLFEGNDKNDIYNFRAGYYLGYILIESIVTENNYSLPQLIKLPKYNLDKHIEEQFKQFL